MTDSVFVQELKKKARDKFGSSDKSSNQEYTDKNSSSTPQAEDPSTYGRMKTDASDIVDQYSRVTEWNNVFMTALFVAIGSSAFGLMGYHAVTKLKNSEFYFGTFLQILAVSLLVGFLLWGIKSITTYSVWKGVIKKDSDPDQSTPFFTVEGMSELSFAIFLPFYFIFSMFFTQSIAMLVLGGAFAFKYVLMYFSYPSVIRNCSKLDRIIFILSSMGVLFILRALFAIVA